MYFLSAMLLSPSPSQPAFLPRFSSEAEVRLPRPAVADGTRMILLLRQAVELSGQRRPGPALRVIEAVKSIDGWDAVALLAFFTLTEEAQIREECGELGACLRLYDEIMILLDVNDELAHLRAHVHLGRAGVFMKRFLLDEAEASLERGRPLAEGQPETLDAGFLINEVELLLCRGRAAKALTLIRPLCAAPRLHYGSAHYLLDLDRLGGAGDAVKREFKGLCDEEGLDTLTAEELMLFVRFSPDDPHSAEWLDEALARMRADGYVSRLVDALLLKAIRSRTSADAAAGSDAAIDALREAVHYAAPEDFLMPFVVEDRLPTALLREAAADERRMWTLQDRAFLERAIRYREERAGAAEAAETGSGAASAVVAAAGTGAKAATEAALATLNAPTEPGTTAVPNASNSAAEAGTRPAMAPTTASVARADGLLTEREREVLAHMALGESNAQIADALFVSLPTVKTHVANILSKLGAARRTEAIEKARKLGLLA
ncbi:MAG TPA: response regulator transcription factor, partial [Spirochaetia bacterium]